MEDHVKTVRSALGALDDRREDDKTKVRTMACKQSTTITIIWITCDFVKLEKHKQEPRQTTHELLNSARGRHIENLGSKFSWSALCLTLWSRARYIWSCSDIITYHMCHLTCVIIWHFYSSMTHDYNMHIYFLTRIFSDKNWAFEWDWRIKDRIFVWTWINIKQCHRI